MVLTFFKVCIVVVFGFLAVDVGYGFNRFGLEFTGFTGLLGHSRFCETRLW